ncbi:MAG: hypothetical protein MHM6MM_002765 [Cercozoa sp. M6MM]
MAGDLDRPLLTDDSITCNNSVSDETLRRANYGALDHSMLDDDESVDGGMIRRHLKDDSNVEVVLEDKRLSLGPAVMNMMNMIVGSGVIGLPNTLNQMGPGLGLLMMSTVALSCEYTARLLIKVGLRVKVLEYEMMARRLWGTFGFVILSVFCWIANFGALASYVVIIRDEVPVVLRNYFGDSWWTETTVVVSVLLVFFALPLFAPRDLSRLAWASTVSTLAITIFVVLVTVRGYMVSDGFKYSDRIVSDLPPYEFVRDDWQRVFQGVGTMSFAFAVHDVTYAMFNTLREHTYKGWVRVTRLSFLASFLIQALFAVCGYATFYGDTEANIMRQFDDSDHIMNGVRIIMGISMILTMPMIHYVARHYLLALLELTLGTEAFQGSRRTQHFANLASVDDDSDTDDEEEHEVEVRTQPTSLSAIPEDDSVDDMSINMHPSEDSQHESKRVRAPPPVSVRASNTCFYGVTLFHFLAAGAIGLKVGDLGLVLEVTGSLAASGVGYVLPVLFYWTVVGFWTPWRRVRRAPTFLSAVYRCLSALVPCFVLAFGLTSMLVGTSLAFVDAFSD